MHYLKLSEVLIIEDSVCHQENLGGFSGRFMYSPMIICGPLILGEKFNIEDRYIILPIEKIDDEFFKCLVDIKYE